MGQLSKAKHQLCSLCVCVSPGMQMLIKGIRSFAPENNAAIEFYKPLTLIVGSNGAGKTVRKQMSSSSRRAQHAPRTAPMQQRHSSKHHALVGSSAAPACLLWQLPLLQLPCCRLSSSA